MTDFSDNAIIAGSIDSLGFQERCRLRFINAAIAVSTEEITIFASGAVTAGTVIPLPSTTGLAASMTIANLTTPANVGANITIASVQAGVSVTASGNVTVAVNDQLVFNPSGTSHATHLRRLSFAGALFAAANSGNGPVDFKMMAMVVLANATNRTNCLAAPNQVGGNILDSDMDFAINSAFTGISMARNW
jgi:hypothetical protein